MRERLTAAFVLLAIVVIAVVVSVRAFTVQDLVRNQVIAQQAREAELIAGLLEEQAASGNRINRKLLGGIISVDAQLAYSGGGRSLVVSGPLYTPTDAISARAEAGDISVELTSGEREVDAVSGRQITSLLTLAVMVALLAGVVGWWIAARLSAPFTALAGAAAALGRGRFDLRLPSTRVPEAHAIGQALKVSASQLESRLSRERDFAEYASHQLRTPLTALQLELEDLTLRDDVPDDAKDAATRCMRRVDDVTVAAGELVSLTRRGALVEGGEVPLSALATEVTQLWSDRLAGARRTVTARADGDLDATFTPGPIEHLLELVLDEVVGGSGPVRLLFVGSPSHLRVTVPPGIASAAPHPGVIAARQLAEAQGGHVTGDLDEAGLDVLMPRR